MKGAWEPKQGWIHKPPPASGLMRRSNGLRVVVAGRQTGLRITRGDNSEYPFHGEIWISDAERRALIVALGGKPLVDPDA